jgi:DNA repair protein RadA/Sms
LQAFAAISQTGLTCLYVSGEESQRQIKMRAERLGISAPNLLVLSETSLERIIEQVKKKEKKGRKPFLHQETIR